MGLEKATDDMIRATIEVLSDTFAPAATPEESARRYTTPQLADAIRDLTGMFVPPELLFAVMSEAGFRYVVDENSSGMKYVWLLKYRN